MQMQDQGWYRSMLCSSSATESIKTAVSTKLHLEHAWVAEQAPSQCIDVVLHHNSAIQQQAQCQTITVF